MFQYTLELLVNSHNTIRQCIHKLDIDNTFFLFCSSLPSSIVLQPLLPPYGVGQPHTLTRVFELATDSPSHTHTDRHTGRHKGSKTCWERK